MGLASFNTRLAGNKQEWNPVLLIFYGLAVWVAGYIERSKLVRRVGPALWIAFGASFWVLGVLPVGVGLVAANFVKDVFYWILYHRITTSIQMDTPTEVIGSVSHARMAQMITILALGELAVGAWQNVLPISWDAGWRAVLCVAVGITTSMGSKSIPVEYVMSGRFFNRAWKTRIGLPLFFGMLSGVLSMTAQANPNELKIHFPTVKLILDPHKMEDAHSMAVVAQLFRGLLRYTPQGEVLPDLAESWQESKDHLQYRFKLKAAKFSDGSKITAKNVQMSFARMFYLGASMGADLDYIQGTRAFRASRNLSQLGIRVLSEREVEFELSRPSGLFLKHLAVVDSAILPIQDFKAELTPTVGGVFSGPYKVAGIPDANHLVIEKWRKDALDSPNPPERVIYWMTDKAAEELALEGLTDCLDHNSLSSPERATQFAQLGWIATPTEIAAEAFVVLNPNKIPAETRRYLYSKVRVMDLVSRLGSQKLRPAYGVIPSWIPGELSESGAEEVRAAAKSAAPPSGSITLELGDNISIERKMAEYLRDVWEAPHFHVEIKELPKAERLRRLFGGTCEACIGRKGLDYPDGFSVLAYFRSGYDSNYFHIRDHRIDAELDRASAALDTQARESIYRSIQVSRTEELDRHPALFWLGRFWPLGTQGEGSPFAPDGISYLAHREHRNGQGVRDEHAKALHGHFQADHANAGDYRSCHRARLVGLCCSPGSDYEPSRRDPACKSGHRGRAVRSSFSKCARGSAGARSFH